jgi:hypothetical protein
MGVNTPLAALFFSAIGLFLLLLLGKLVDIYLCYIDGKSITTEKYGQQKITLARQDEPFISGMIWADVGNEL